MRVKQLSEELDIPADTIRYYTRIGLLNPQTEPNGYKNYSARDRNYLRFAIRARQLGFSLDDIQEIIQLSESGESPCQRVRSLMQKNLVRAEKSFREIQRLRNRMHKAVESWESMPDGCPSGTAVCELIENWDLDSEAQDG